jgi:hypothetical protein
LRGWVLFGVYFGTQSMSFDGNISITGRIWNLAWYKRNVLNCLSKHNTELYSHSSKTTTESTSCSKEGLMGINRLWFLYLQIWYILNHRPYFVRKSTKKKHIPFLKITTKSLCYLIKNKTV